MRIESQRDQWPHRRGHVPLNRREAAVARTALELSDEEARLLLDFIRQSGGKMKAKFGPAEKVDAIPTDDFLKAFGGPQASGKWYHASPHDLPEGTQLTPGGGGATSQDFYDMGYGDDTGTLQDMGAGRAGHVWLSPTEDDVHFWSAALNAPHIYEVEPDDEPQPWNGTAVDGWVTPGARIVRKVSSTL